MKRHQCPGLLLAVAQANERHADAANSLLDEAAATKPAVAGKPDNERHEK